MKVYGYNFIEDVLDGDILKKMYDALPYDPDFDGAQTMEYVYGNYFINRKITQLERKRLLSAAGEISDVSLFTLDKDARIPHVTNYGAVDYYSEMPYIFKGSKINLNITLRSIYSGIPLRAMDIMAAGGFLLTNYQEDFLRHFEPGVHFDYFESEGDMKDKITYYLSHEEERRQIAANAQNEIERAHTFKKRLEEIFGIALGTDN